MEMNGTTNGQRETRDHVPIDIEEAQASRLVTSMKAKLQTLSPISSDCCIYRVPKSLRDINKDAYTPRFVSIGPLHHGKKGFEAMEDHKWRYLGNFLERNNINLDASVRFMKKHEKKTRQFYAEAIDLSSDQFIQVVLVDAIFIVDILLDFSSSHSASSVRSFYQKSFFLYEVYRDMMLIENQLPFFVLEETLGFAKRTVEDSGSSTSEWLSIIQLTHNFFNFFVEHEGIPDNVNTYEIRHFVDFLRLCHLPAKTRQQPKHEGKLELIQSLTKLREAGVKFKLASTKQLLDIQLKNGVLEVPSIFVDETTETFFRNLLAFDQLHHGFSHISDYIVLMDSLINTPDDVELLVKNGIMKNSLSDNLEASKLFNNLGKEIAYSPHLFYYSHLCEELNDFCKIPWHKWKATLTHNYLNSPWAVISIIAASILLVLTLIQTFSGFYVFHMLASMYGSTTKAGQLIFHKISNITESESERKTVIIILLTLSSPTEHSKCRMSRIMSNCIQKEK